MRHTVGTHHRSWKGARMAIHEWPIGERPREKMLERGPSALSDAELLAVIIGCGTRGRSAVDVGREVIKQFGSLRQFLTADRRQCLKQLGIGPVRLLILQAALELRDGTIWMNCVPVRPS